ncbi:hypothetical protein GCM10009839_90130 [Catenulispora yoronensis]|uniref:Uncharacterized protein n=1 Tax=Catenulispora yoronensis TaxID=450799 RepID=A0ABP5H6N4_9ACTN
MEQKAHDVFTRLAAGEEPPLGFTADDVVDRGRRQARARRAATVAGAAAGMLAVGAGVLPLWAFKSDGRPAPPAPPGATVIVPTKPTALRTSSSEDAAPDPGCVADLGRLDPSEGHFEGPEKTAALQTCRVLKRVDAVLDPDGKHLSNASPGFHQPSPIDIINGFSSSGGMTTFDGVESQIAWTADGHYPFKNDNKPDMSGPYVQVWITIQAAGGSDPYPSAPDHQINGQSGSTRSWGPTAVYTLTDGSKLTLTREQDRVGAAALATHSYPSGNRLLLYVNTAQDAGTGSLPFTDDQLVAAVDVPGIEDVQLPIDSGRLPASAPPSPR